MTAPPRMRSNDEAAPGRSGWWWAVGLSVLAPAPALVEMSVDAIVSPEDGSRRVAIAKLDVDAHGLLAREVAIDRRGHRWTADEVRVRTDGRGVVVDVAGVRAEPLADPPAERPVERASSGSSAGPKTSWLDRVTVPIELHVIGAVEVPPSLAPLPVTLTAYDPRVRREPDGRFVASGRWTAVGPNGTAVELDGTWTGDGGTQIRGSASLRAGEHPPIELAGAFDGTTLRLLGADGPSNVRVELRHWSSVWPNVWTAEIAAEHMPLSALAPWLAPRGLRVDDARLDGELTATRRGSAIDVAARGLAIDGLTVDHRGLARGAVAFDRVVIDGAAKVDVGTGAWSVELDHLRHRDLRGRLSARRASGSVEASFALDPLPCQALLDGLPTGLVDRIEGTRLDGDVSASLSLAYDEAALVPDPPAEALPGRLSIEFPFLERCRVLADPPPLDFQALRGAYRHRFTGPDGREHTRLIAPDAPGTVRLRDVPTVAAAFVTLEDGRFWQHDGFDREQIARAVWHNLAVGRVSRGASTITQQAARVLFLGIDRSLGRKLQEAFLAARLEQTLDKQRILELYLNVIELGPGIFGVEDAAQYYFGKPASELSVVQAVHLASLAPAPVTYARRFASGRIDDAWKVELRTQVERLYLYRRLSHDDFLRALRQDLELVAHSH